MRALSKEYQPLAAATGHRRDQPIVSDKKMDRIRNLNRERNIPEYDKFTFLMALGSGFLPREIHKAGRGPGGSVLAQWKRDDRRFAAAFAEIWECLPYSVQARGQRVGREFKAELRNLFDSGLSDKEAARRLGVTAMTCNRITKEWREKSRN
jgi:hypothetical protein